MKDTTFPVNTIKGTLFQCYETLGMDKYKGMIGTDIKTGKLVRLLPDESDDKWTGPREWTKMDTTLVQLDLEYDVGFECGVSRKALKRALAAHAHYYPVTLEVVQ